MNLLVQASNTLYNREILELQREVFDLKRRLKEEEINNGSPIVIFNDVEEFNKWVMIFHKCMLKTIKECIINNDNLKNSGLTFDQCCIIMKSIFENLYSVTKNQEWSLQKSNSIMNRVNISIQNMISNGLWQKIYNIDEIDPSSIVYNMIESEIGNLDNNYYGVISDISFFKCNICGNQCKYDVTSSVCIMCESCHKHTAQ